ncbi:DUF1573 domain-containing protein [Aridibaculum aurantiacum]|uniref:DUF1573 domain-containing protein n=1 Tax=Aridibaculum aurantiacum TaxID=2810307 RepID=UPI001A975D14|nr:DUF1573 domain-containing protein [Aridibaculum aurantiacum]
MKKILSLLIALVAVSTVFAQGPLEFKVAKHNFGKIKQGVPVTYNFQFTNNSNGVVVIENATAECGCTTPEYPKSPIAKGATKTIKVTYNAEAIGSFTKKVTVKVANVAEPIYLHIEGEVVDAKASAAKPAAKGKPASKKS